MGYTITLAARAAGRLLVPSRLTRDLKESMRRSGGRACSAIMEYHPMISVGGQGLHSA